MADFDLDKPCSNNEAGVLAALWRKVLNDLGINHLARLSVFIDKYLQKTDPLNGEVANLRRKNKSTVNKNIVATEMTFKTFMDLMLNLLNVVKIDISVKIYFPNGEHSVHTITVSNTKDKPEQTKEDSSVESKEDNGDGGVDTQGQDTGVSKDSS